MLPQSSSTTRSKSPRRLLNNVAGPSAAGFVVPAGFAVPAGFVVPAGTAPRALAPDGGPHAGKVPGGSAGAHGCPAHRAVTGPGQQNRFRGQRPECGVPA